MKRTALISGASGLVGQELLELLLASDQYKTVYALARKPMQIKHEKLQEIIFDYTSDEEYNKLPAVYDGFCCLGTTIKKAGSKEAFKAVDFEYPLKLAKALATKESSSFHVITALGADPNSGVFYNKVKGELEEALKKLKFAHLYIYQPSLLVGNRKESRPGEKIAIKLFPVLELFMIGGLKKYKSIKVENVAKGIIYTALHDKTKTKTILSDEIQTLASLYSSL